MSKFNMYYYGEDRSHCGSCWERDDEDTQVLLTPLTLDEMKEKLKEYCRLNLSGNWGSFGGFFDYVVSESEEDDDELDELNYPCIRFEITGSSYAPDMSGSSISYVEYDVTKHLNPEEVVEDWKKLNEKWEEAAKKKREREIAEKERKEKNAERQRKYRAKKKEFEDYQKLKEKWEGKKIPEEPKDDPKPKIKIDPKKLSEFAKFLEKARGGS